MATGRQLLQSIIFSCSELLTMTDVELEQAAQELRTADDALSGLKEALELDRPSSRASGADSPAPAPLALVTSPDDCAVCEGHGWLLGVRASNLTTVPYPDDLLVARCTDCKRFGTDLEAGKAVQAANRKPLLLWAVCDGAVDGAGLPVPYQASVPWLSPSNRQIPKVRPRYQEGIYLIEPASAAGIGIYPPKD